MRHLPSREVTVQTCPGDAKNEQRILQHQAHKAMLKRDIANLAEPVTVSNLNPWTQTAQTLNP